MLLKFPERSMPKKLSMFEYLNELIEIITRPQKEKLYNYNKLAEQYALKYHISKKEKEVLIELLEQFYPPAKRELGELRQFRRGVAVKRETKKTSDRRGNQAFDNSPKKDYSLPELKRGATYSKKKSQDSSANFRETSIGLENIKSEDYFKRMKKKFPELKSLRPIFDNQISRLTSDFSTVNGLDCIIHVNQSQAKVEAMVTGPVMDIIELNKTKEDNIHLCCQFKPDSLTLKNIRIEEALLYYGLTSVDDYGRIKVRQLLILVHRAREHPNAGPFAEIPNRVINRERKEPGIFNNNQPATQQRHLQGSPSLTHKKRPQNPHC